MSFIIKIKERKNDGWYYDDEIAPIDAKGIYESDLNIWNRALMNVFHNSDLYHKWENCKDNNERKKVLWESMQIELNSLKECLEFDLKNCIKIYPLIKNFIWEYTGRGNKRKMTIEQANEYGLKESDLMLLKALNQKRY